MNLKKMMAVGVAAVTILSFSACKGGSPKETTLTGTWKSGEIDMTESFAKSFDENFDSNVSIAGYLPKIAQTVDLTLEEDKNYTMVLTVDTDIDAFRSSFTEFLGEVLTEINNGVPFTEEELIEIFGGDLETLASEYTTDEELSFLLEDDTITGTYTEENGTITLDDGTTGTFDGKTLVLDLEDVDLGMVEFTKK